MKIAIRPLTLADLDVAGRITQLAYQMQVDPRARLRRYLQLQPDGWFLALLDDVPVGMGGVVDYGAFAYIGQLGVHPDMQRRGVGTALLEYILAWLERRDCPTALLDASEQGTPLYLRYGFLEEDLVAHWVREPAVLPAPLLMQKAEPAQVRLATFSLEDMIEVTALDAAYFGAGRAAVFATLLVEYPERAIVARDSDGHVWGHLFVQETTLGPWVAASAEVAEALLRQALARHFVQQAVVFAPAANKDADRLLEHYGFRKQRTLRHMRRGAAVTFRRREKLYGQASLGLG